jgi:adenylyl-sulfate kinase
MKNPNKMHQNIEWSHQNPKPFILWFTGLSGAGKSSIANAVADRISQFNDNVHLLDGDVVRKGLCADLTFTDTDRDENIRRVSEVAKLMLDSGSIVLAALITPTHFQRKQARETFQHSEYIEVFVDTALEECEKRDIKGLYKKARSGEIKNFTGIDSEYERPTRPDIHIKTIQQTIDESVNQVFNYLFLKGYLNAPASR